MSTVSASGQAWKFGDQVDTDAIIPGRFLPNWLQRPDVIRENCFADLRPGFSGAVSSGDFVVGGHNFGCGSSREAAALAIKSNGVAAVIAGSVSRIFYRNCFNLGLPALESPQAAAQIAEGDRISVDLAGGQIVNSSKDETYAFAPIPKFMLDLLDQGGLEPYVQRQLEQKKGNIHA